MNSRRLFFPRFWSGLLVLLAAFVTLPSYAATCNASPRLNSSFIEGYYPSDWTTSQWNTAYANLKNACINNVIIQYAAESDPSLMITYYPPGSAVAALGFSQGSSTDVIGNALSRADTAGVSVVVGLQLPGDAWWSSAGDASWLDNELKIAKALAQDLASKYGSHSSFAGWYIAFEMDNCQLQTLTDQQTFVDHFLGPLTKTLNTVKSGAKVYISPYFDSVDGCGSVSAWSTEWKNIFQRLRSSSNYGNLNVITMQDGVGAFNDQTSDLPPIYSALKNAITSYDPSVALWTNSEVYSDPNNPNPMPLKTVVADMKAVAPYVTGYTSFSWAEFYNPQFVNSAYNATYQNYLSTGSVETSAPTAPWNLTARSAGSRTRKINLAWSGSSDNIGVVAYQIFRNGSLINTIYAGVTGQPPTSYTDSGLTRYTTYTYQISALDAAGNVSSRSNSASATAN